MKRFAKGIFAKIGIIIVFLYELSGCTPNGARDSKKEDVISTHYQSENKTKAAKELNGENKENMGSVQINYTLKYIPKIASNQIAVWIEDINGNYIRTLYATKYTAEGGYRNRNEALPLWIRKSNWKNADQSEIDAISGATRKPGNITFTWDCKDRTGQPVKSGEYVYVIEGNIYWNDRVVCKGKIEVSNKENKSLAEIKYEPESAVDNGVLIEKASAVFIPKNN